MKEIKKNNTVIDYKVSGNGDTTLLFAHGSYIDQSYWDEQVKYFSPHYKVVTFDFPGQGKSGRERNEWSVKGFAEDVLAVVHELELKNVILIGHSLAGDINLVAATSSAKDFIGFIAIDFFKNAGTALPGEFQSQVDTILDNLRKDFAQTNEQYARMALLTKETPESISERVVKDYRDAYQPMGMQIMPEIFELYKMEAELLPLLKFKLNLINVDYMPTNEEALKKYAGTGYEILHMKGTSHYPMLEDAATLNKLLQQLITDIEKK